MRHVTRCKDELQSLVKGADDKAHYTVWRSVVTNGGGESLLNFILVSNKAILQRRYLDLTTNNTSKRIEVENRDVLNTLSFSYARRSSS